MAEFLDTFFAGFDLGILEAMHNFAVETGGFFTPFMHFFSFLAIVLIAVSCALLLFRRTRRLGALMMGGICIGVLFTNIVIKNIVARARPYADVTRAVYDWWQYVGAPEESGVCFPSGHTTCAMAGMTGLFLGTRKKYSWPAFFFVVLMGVSRIYLAVHYPTDVLGGIVTGAVSAVIAFFVVRTFWRLFEAHADNGFCRFVLTFDLVDFCRAHFGKKKAASEADVAAPENGADESQKDGE